MKLDFNFLQIHRAFFLAQDIQQVPMDRTLSLIPLLWEETGDDKWTILAISVWIPAVNFIC